MFFSFSKLEEEWWIVLDYWNICLAVELEWEVCLSRNILTKSPLLLRSRRYIILLLSCLGPITCVCETNWICGILFEIGCHFNVIVLLLPRSSISIGKQWTDKKLSSLVYSFLLFLVFVFLKNSLHSTFHISTRIPVDYWLNAKLFHFVCLYAVLSGYIRYIIKLNR